MDFSRITFIQNFKIKSNIWICQVLLPLLEKLSTTTSKEMLDQTYLPYSDQWTSGLNIVIWYHLLSPTVRSPSSAITLSWCFGIFVMVLRFVVRDTWNINQRKWPSNAPQGSSSWLSGVTEYLLTPLPASLAPLLALCQLRASARVSTVPSAVTRATGDTRFVLNFLWVFISQVSWILT